MKAVALPALVFMAACGTASGHYPFGNWDTAQQPNHLLVVRVDARRLPGGIMKFYMSEAPPTTLATGDSLNSIITTLGQAVDLWNAVPNSALRLELAGAVNTVMPLPPSFPAGLLRFTEDVPPGAAATGGPLVGSRSLDFFPITTSRVNFPLNMSNLPSSGQFLLTVTHELGHSLGLHHTLPRAVMYQSSAQSSRARVLWPDDEAGFASLYPTPGFASSTGTIAGRVTSGGSPVVLAGVTAIGTGSSAGAIGTYTAPDGGYRITGLPPGPYKVAVQPLPLGAAPSSAAFTTGDPNDLIVIRTLTGQGIRINTDIDSQLFGGTFDPAASPDVAVAAGGTRSGVDFDVGARGPARLEALSFSATLPSGRSVSPAMLLPGSSLRVTASGIGLSPNMALAALGPGLTVDATSLRSVTVTPRPHINSGISFVVNTDAGAPAGSRTLLLGSGADRYLAPGYLMVAAGQPPTMNSVTPGSGTAGTAVTISGASFSPEARVFFDGVPADNVTVADSSTLQVTAPLHLPGTSARVFVYHPDGFGSHMLAAPPVFQYAAGPAPALSIQPASARPGESFTLAIRGADTHFAAGRTTIGFGGGDVAVDSFSVTSPTEITARLWVAPSVRSTRYSLGVVTAGEFVTLPNALQVLTGTPASVAVVSGHNQTGPAGGVLRLPGAVRVLDAAGNPVEGTEVSFAFTAGTGQVTPPRATTDQFGRAQAAITLGPEAGTQAVTASAGGGSATFRFTALGQSLPVLSAGGVVNAASFAGPVAPGSIVSLFGSNLSASTASASSLPLPTTVGNATVRINGFSAPLFFVSPGQINAQVPYQVSGSLQVTATVGSLTSATLAAPLVSAAPGIFTLNQNGRGPAVALHAGFTPVNAASPARRGEVVLVFATGLGAVQPPVATGAAAPGPSQVTQTTTAAVGGASANVEYSGVAPGFAGLYQVNLQVPPDAPAGDAVELRITVGGQASNVVTIAVR